MAKRTKSLKIKEPRAESEWVFFCHAPTELFLANYEDIPQPIRHDLAVNGHIPCEGGGIPGPWCEECRFKESECMDTSIHDPVTNPVKKKKGNST